MSDVTPQAENGSETAVTPEPAGTAVEAPPPPRRPARLVGIGLILLSVVLGWLLLVGFLAYQSGQSQRTSQQEVDLLANLERQTTLAAENIGQGNYELALRRLEWVLAREPGNREAQQMHTEATQALAAHNQASPLASPTPPPPTATPEPSPTPGQISSPEEELQRIRRLSVNKEWEEALTSIITFQRQFPSYEREETDRLLFDAYVGRSQSLMEANQPELGLYYLAQAEKLGNLPQAMLDYRTWAELYTQGISFYGVNWDAAAYYFRDLCLAAPFFGDACTKLFNILVAHGDQYASVEDWCPAQLLYEEAWRSTNGTQPPEKLETARNGCLSATPTPTGPITDTLPITGTVPITNPLPETGEPFVIPSPAP